MRLRLLSVLVAGCTVCGHAAAGAAAFEDPVRVEADGVPVRVESPGYAAPCWADLDGDDRKDLLVGQFNGGKIRVYRNLGDGKLGGGQWLRVEGQAGEADSLTAVFDVLRQVVQGKSRVAEVPGVW